MINFTKVMENLRKMFPAEDGWRIIKIDKKEMVAHIKNVKKGLLYKITIRGLDAWGACAPLVPFIKNRMGKA